LKDSQTVVLEWTWNSSNKPLKLLVIENDNPLSMFNLNLTQSYFLLENLKPSTNYSLCLQSTNEQNLCRNITTKNSQLISIESSSSPSSIINIEYLIIGISFGIIIILLILCLLIVHLMKQREKYSHSSKTTTLDSYYQTSGSDTTQIAMCNNSIEERSVNSLHPHPSTPIICYCQLHPNYSHEQQAYHFYHEIPPYQTPIII
jgi:hypothetical protein